MNTEQIMRFALEMAQMSVIPADSAVYCPRDSIKRILLGIDITLEDVQRAKEMGCDLVFEHHPLDWVAYPEVFEYQPADG